MGGSNTVIEGEKLAGVQLQSAAYGNPIPIVYGTNRVPGQVIWHDDFQQIRHEDSQNVGKGGSTMTRTSYTYKCSVIMALCEGPIDGINRVWKDKEIASLSKYGFSLYTGARAQTPWSWLTTKHSTKALGYGGTAYVAASALDLGDTARLGNHSFEVRGFFISHGNDAHPMDVIADLLTNPYYGAAWPGERLDDWTDYWTYCTASGFFMSPVIDEQRTLLEWLDLLLKATNTCPVFSGGVLKLIPYGDTVVSGNGHTFTPNTTPLYDLTVDDLIFSSDEDPIKVSRTSQQDTFNCVPVEFTDRTAEYNTSVVEDPDPVDVEAFGLRKDQPLALHMITLRDVALRISRILAQRQVYCRNEYTFQVSWRHMLLEPMDLVTLTEPKLGLDHKVVRIKSVEEGEEGEDGFTIVAEEWPFGVASATAYTTGTTDGTVFDVNADPGDALAPVVFEAPLVLTDWDYQLWLATAGSFPWGGCDVFVSDSDGASYARVGRMRAPSTFGAITGAINASASSITVDISACGGELKSFTTQQRDDLLSMCWLDGEMIGYAGATLVGAGIYTLDNVVRGVAGTTAASHSVGAKFVFLDDTVFKHSFPISRLSTQFKIKLVSYNAWGGGYQDISSVTEYAYTPTNVKIVPPYPSSVTLTVGTTEPGSSVGHQRRSIQDDSYGTGWDTSDYPSIRRARWLTVSWSPVTISPASLLTGYRIVYFTGADPNDVRNYVFDPQVVRPGTTALTLKVTTPATTKTIYVAVQALYGTDESSWRTSTGSVVLDPDTFPLADASVFGSLGLDDANASIWYRGNCDITVRGGAPNIACVSVINSSTTIDVGKSFDIKITPTVLSDNLDGLRYAKIEWYEQSVRYNSNNPILTALGTTFVALPDRLYHTPGTIGDASNVPYVTASIVNSGAIQFTAAKITIYNAHGPSDTHCFYTPAAGTTLTDNGTSWPGAFGSVPGGGGGTGGGGGVGGDCPAPWVPILLADGREVPAGAVKVGDKVRTQHEETGAWGDFEVYYAQPSWNTRLWLETMDGRKLLFAANHRFKTPDGWKELCALVPGDVLLGCNPAFVRSVRPGGYGPVVHIAVRNASTYITEGLLSHNMKKQTP